MKRFSSVFFGLTLAAALAGCGNGNNNNGSTDMATTGAKPDLSMTGSMPDLVVSGAATGEPCTKATDCAKGNGPNQNGACQKSQMTTGGGTLTWPDGYCTSPCRPSKNDPNNQGLNPDCPGGNATCEGTGTTGTCVAYCQSSEDCRNGGKDYSCFVVNNVAPLGCLPTALSECDPAKAGSCPRMCADGGAQDDGGAGCFESTCVNIGDSTVGSCVAGCDPFTNMGCPGGQDDSDCHASDVTGEGLCTGACTSAACQNGSPAGSACGNFYSDCPGGYGCLSGKCWKYCNDANKGTQCSSGATCTKFSMMSTVPTSVAGICSKSN